MCAVIVIINNQHKRSFSTPSRWMNCANAVHVTYIHMPAPHVPQWLHVNITYKNICLLVILLFFSVTHSLIPSISPYISFSACRGCSGPLQNVCFVCHCHRSCELEQDIWFSTIQMQNCLAAALFAIENDAKKRFGTGAAIQTTRLSLSLWLLSHIFLKVILCFWLFLHIKS